MSVSVTGDETDRKAEGLRAERQKVLKQKHRSVRDRAEEIIARDLDKTMLINPDPTKRYKWVNRTAGDGERVQIHEGYGYDVVKPKEGGVKPIVGRDKDGAFIQGGQVLMECPVEVYEQRRKDSDRKGRRASMAYRESAREELNRIARDGRLARPHTDIVTDESREGREKTITVARDA